MTGSRALWSVADTLGEIVPAPPSPRLARLIAGWWPVARWGCVTARRVGGGVVVAPRPEVWCANCADFRFRSEVRCCYCGADVTEGAALLLHYEIGNGAVLLLARAHPSCHEGE